MNQSDGENGRASEVPAVVPESEVPATIDNVKDLFIQRPADEFDKIATAGKWLPRIQLITASSKLGKSGKFAINHFAFIPNQNTNIDLGETVDVFLLAWRSKALSVAEPVMSVFDVNLPEFKQIQAIVDAGTDSAWYGPEFLVYIPSIKKCATLFMGSPSARTEAVLYRGIMEDPETSNWVTLSPHEIVTKKYTWYLPTPTECSAEYDLPPLERLLDIQKLFDSVTIQKAADAEPEPESESISDAEPERAR